MDLKNDPNCAEPACHSKVEVFSSIMRKQSKTANAKDSLLELPLSREELGNATWGLLHSMAIYYPKNPTKEYQEKAKTFIETLALMYPCVHCAEDFQKELVKSPPMTDSRTSLSLWLCAQHNIVNKKIGKPLFSCTMENLDKRWRTGPQVHNNNEDETKAESLGQE